MNREEDKPVNAGHHLPATVEPVLSAVPVFIGYTERSGTDAVSNDTTMICHPKKINSLVAYEECFGTTPRETIRVCIHESRNADTDKLNGPGVEVACDVRPAHKMYYHMQMYFVNGGGPCYVVSVGDANAGKVTIANLLAGLKTAEECQDATLTVCPQVEGLSADDAAAFYRAALKQADERRDRFAVFDCFDNDDALLVRELVGLRHLSFGAVYHPYLKTSLPVLYDTNKINVEYVAEGRRDTNISSVSELPEKLRVIVTDELKKLTVTLPPSSAISGMYCRNDAVRNVWSAPADLVLSNVLTPATEIDGKGQAAHIADSITGKSINVIRAIPKKGAVVIGARTLAGSDRDWKYISMRRLFIMIESSIRKSVALFSSEANNGKTWVEIQLLIENFLMSLWYKGVLQGADPDRAYFVKVGLGETMTERDISANRLIVDVGLAPVIPSEFIRFKIVQQMGRADT